jgi:hypothetical protein
MSFNKPTLEERLQNWWGDVLEVFEVPIAVVLYTVAGLFSLGFFFAWGCVIMAWINPGHHIVENGIGAGLITIIALALCYVFYKDGDDTAGR